MTSMLNPHDYDHGHDGGDDHGHEHGHGHDDGHEHGHHVKPLFAVYKSFLLRSQQVCEEREGDKHNYMEMTINWSCHTKLRKQP